MEIDLSTSQQLRAGMGVYHDLDAVLKNDELEHFRRRRIVEDSVTRPSLIAAQRNLLHKRIIEVETVRLCRRIASRDPVRLIVTGRSPVVEIDCKWHVGDMDGVIDHLNVADGSVVITTGIVRRDLKIVAQNFARTSARSIVVLETTQGVEVLILAVAQARYLQRIAADLDRRVVRQVLQSQACLNAPEEDLDCCHARIQREITARRQVVNGAAIIRQPILARTA
ncbi:hypothetical protein ACSFBL_22405 [Variovorax sp. GT1P44]